MNGGNGWIDLPVVQAMEYFSSVLATAFSWAERYALLFGLIGIIWSAFKLANNRLTVKDFWWDTLFKWTGFILLMTLYPSITMGFSQIANEIGIKAGKGEEAIVEGLTSIRNTLKKDLIVQEQAAQNITNKLESNFENLQITTEFGACEDYNDFIKKLGREVDAQFSTKNDRKGAKKMIKEFKDRNRFVTMFNARNLKAIESVLIEKNLDGTDGDDLTNSYTELDIWLKTADGKDSMYISPSATLRVALLNCQILFAKEQQHFIEVKEEIQNNTDLSMIERGVENLGAGFSRIPQILMTFLCCLVIICSTIFALIQYVMTIIEYTIVVGIGAIFIPLLLFDGTKDIPKKLIPVFTGFMVKMIVMTICIMFVFWTMIDSTINTILDDGGMNWVTVADVMFNGILCFILTQNGPKVAQTILTGQPQLSMGEFMAAAGTAGAGMIGLSKLGVKGTRGAANAGINTAGKLARGVNTAKTAASTASHATKEALSKSGASADTIKTASRKAGWSAGAKGLASGMIAQPGKELLKKVHESGHNFLHGETTFPTADKALGKGTWNGASGSSAGGGTGSGKARGTSGRNPHNTDNYKYKTAKDGEENSLTVKQFLQNKVNQGGVEGEAIGQKYADKAIKKAQENNNTATNTINNTKLADNLTGETRGK